MDENQIYHLDTSRISKSGLDLIDKAPAKYYAKYLDKNFPAPKDKKHFNFGSALHSSILENDLFRSEYIVSPEFSGSGSQAKKAEFDQMNIGKKQITLLEYKSILGMAEAVKSNKKAYKLLFDGIAENQFNWLDDDTGAKCKCKPDFLNSDNYIIDLKSTDDASEAGFKRSGRKFRYFVQDPFYTDGLEKNGIRVKGFIFIAVEKEYPFLVNLFIYDKEDQNLGREIYKENLKTWLNCKNSGIWPGYGDDIKSLNIY
jgi:hypothetical protein